MKSFSSSSVSFKIGEAVFHNGRWYDVNIVDDFPSDSQEINIPDSLCLSILFINNFYKGEDVFNEVKDYIKPFEFEGETKVIWPEIYSRIDNDSVKRFITNKDFFSSPKLNSIFDNEEIFHLLTKRNEITNKIISLCNELGESEGIKISHNVDYDPSQTTLLCDFFTDEKIKVLQKNYNQIIIKIYCKKGSEMYSYLKENKIFKRDCKYASTY